MGNIIIDQTGTIPTTSDSDSLFFATSGANVENGLDSSGLTTGLTSVYVSEQWVANIGTPSTSLKADIDAAAGSVFRYAAGGGACWYTPTGGSSVCTLLRNVSNGTMTLNGTGTVTRLESGSGQTVVGQNVACTNIHIGGGNVKLEGTSGTGPTVLEMTGGSYTTRRGATTMTVWGGSALIDASTNTITTLTMAGPTGMLNIVQSGTITTFNFVAGDANQITISRPITITNTVIWATVRNASKFLDNPLVTFTNTPTWRIDQGSK